MLMGQTVSVHKMQHEFENLWFHIFNFYDAISLALDHQAEK
jgi:hypothetical protein